MSMRALALVLAAAAVFAGCSASGLDAKESFACKAPEGVTCLSVSGVYEASRRSALPGQQPSAPQGTRDHHPATNPPRAAPIDSTGRSMPGAHRAGLSSGTPLRSAPRVLRIWLAPYEDSEGDLRDQSHIYVTVDEGRWQIEHTRRAIQDRFAPIRALAPVAPPPATNGAAAGADPFPGARVPDALPAAGVPGSAATPSGDARMGWLALPFDLVRGGLARLGAGSGLASEALGETPPQALTRAGRSRSANAFSAQLPYTTWRASQAVFYLEGASPGSVDGVGFVLELCPQTGATEQMAAILGSLFTACPKGTGLQISLFATNQIEEHLAAYQGLRPDAGLFHKFAARRAAHYRAGARGTLFASRPYQLRHVRIALSVVLPCTDLADMGRVQQLLTLREAMIATLRSVYLFGHVWDAEDLVNWCAPILNPQELVHGAPPRLRYDPDTEIRDQIIAADTLHRVTPEGLVFGLPALGNETVVKAFSVRSYPPTYALHGMGALLGDAFQASLGYPCPFLITLGVRTLDYDAMRHAVTLRSARATQNAASQMARFQSDLLDRKRDWELAQRAFDAGGSLVQLYHQVLVLAPRPEQTRAEHAVRAVWRARGFELMPDTYMQVQALLSSLPMALSPALQHDIAQAKRFSTKTLANAVNLAPLLGEWTGCGAPVIPLFGRRGQAMGIDLFSNTAGNYNAAVIGTSGAGKSSFMNEIALAYLSTGARVWIIDVGRSYQKLCHAVGGAFIEFGEAGRFSLNPFALVEDIDADMEMLRPAIAQMASPNAPLDQYQLSWLDMAIRAVWYEHGRQATLTQLAEHLKTACKDETERCDPRVRDLGVQLFPFTADGAYGKYFAGAPPLDFHHDFIVLELEELKAKKDLQAVVLLMLMYRITREMYLTRERRKLVIVDEAWELLRGVGTGEFLEAGYRRARKYNGAFITGTQSIEDYTKSAAASAALENADWIFMLRQKPESLAALEASQRLPMNETMRAMLRSLQTEHGSFAEVFVHCPTGYGVGLVIFDPFTLLLASSRAEDMVAVDRYRRLGLSTEDAIERVLAERAAAPRTERAGS